MKDELDKFLDRYNEQQHELSGWISEYRASRAEVERLKIERDKLKEGIKKYVHHWDKYFSEPKVGQPPEINDLRKLF